jgi:hypothetical protein
MPFQDEFGFVSTPTNGLGIVRAKTLVGNLRLWDIPRSEQALDILIGEIGQSPIPGIYILFDERGGKKAYIGQTENIKGRLGNHIRTPEDKIKGWERAIVINDGRNAEQSELNDENIRLVLENYLVDLFKINRYKVVTQSSRIPSLSSSQATIIRSFKAEINILLSNKNKISKFLTERADNEVYLDDARRILKQRGYTIQEWGAKYAVVNGEPVIVRPGSAKAKGWQVTFRGSKSLSGLSKGDGYMLMPRGKILFIPLAAIRDFVASVDSEAFRRDTLDIFIRFDEERIVLVYKDRETTITSYAVQTSL